MVTLLTVTLVQPTTRMPPPGANSSVVVPVGEPRNAKSRAACKENTALPKAITPAGRVNDGLPADTARLRACCT